MIEIGEILLKDSDIVKESIKKVPIRTRKNEVRYVIKMNFDLKNEVISFDIEEMDDNSVEKYLYFGHQGGANQLQWNLTYDKCNNIVSHVFPTLYEKLEDNELKHLTEKVIKTFFLDQGEDISARYRYVLNVDRFFNFEWNLYEVREEKIRENPKNADKNLLQFVSNEITKFSAKKFEIKTEQIGLFTVCINNQVITETEEYLETVRKSFQSEEKKETTKTKKSTDRILACSVCGSTENCISKIDIVTKFYTTNLSIFAHKMIKKNYDKNLVLCEECHNKFKAASRFMENDLKTKIAGYDAYILPHVIYGENLNAKKIKQMAETIEPISGTGEALNTVAKYRSEIERKLNLLNEENYIFLLNIMFFRKVQASTKIHKLIQDVEPSVFKALSDAFYDSLDVFYKYYPDAVVDNLSKRANLKFIYFMHPIKLKDGGPAQFQNVLSTYENILTQKSLNMEVVFSNISEILTVIWREKEGYNVSFNKTQTNRQNAFDYKVLDSMFYINFLERYGSLKGGAKMSIEMLNLKDDISTYIKEMGYDEQQTSLFLLGVLIGAIGREQSKRQYERQQEGTYKPILNKINFNGMDKYRIMKLSNQIPEKLRHEKILQYYEGIYSAHQYLLDKNKQNWKLNKDENLFYLLSGYGYQTMKRKSEKVSDEREV